VRRLSLLISFLWVTTLTSGCTQWTEFGQGGAAEDLPASVFIDPDSEQGQVVHELRQDVDYSRQYLDVLILRGAQRCFPASVYTASLGENRVARELAGGLIEDAATSLVNLRLELQQLEQKLDAITNADGCWLQDAETMSASLVGDEVMQPAYDETRLLALLNSDNQFAHGSHLVNPKYEQNLIEACSALREIPRFELRITGHADASGDRDQNIVLSSKRAMTVVNLLTDCGIAAGRIKLSFEGDNLPQYSGRSPEIDLVNRRVSIELEISGQRSLQ
jgi:outer membrane protein OmpA-like peptidoglycan-associated protein